MFLFPALASGVADFLILYLSYYGHKEIHSDEDFGGHDYIYNVSYLTPLAWTRLVLLIVPLPYHAYTGTGVKYPLFYHMLYGGTIVAVSMHMLCIIMLDPDSLNILLPTPAVAFRQLLKTEHHTMSHIWILLSLTLWSTVAHTVLLWHVRSTAPHEPSYELKRKQRMAYYYAKEGSTLILPFGNEDEDDSLLLGGGDDVLSYTNSNSNLVLPDDHHFNNMSIGQRRHSLIQKMRCINDGYDDFISEIQTKLNKTRQQWAERLDEFTTRIASSQNNNNNNGDTRGAAGAPFSIQQLTPFRVLLQLFAYEEVITNHRLDQVFEMDDGEAMTFYVPQLLSFLLHGAFHNSPQLEEWILNKCSHNIHFAHRCYWFLRAWCMEGSHNYTTAINNNGHHNHSRSITNNQRSSSNASFGSLKLTDDTTATTNANAGRTTASSNMSTGSLEGMMLGGGETGSTMSNNKPSKYHPEEESLIEALLTNVMVCGEHPAWILHHGQPEDHSEENINTSKAIDGIADDTHKDVDDDFNLDGEFSSPSKMINGFQNKNDKEKHKNVPPPLQPLSSAASSFSSYTNSVKAVASGVVPIDPFDGNPSPRHLQTIYAKKKFGFIPLDDAKDSWLQEDDDEHEATTEQITEQQQQMKQPHLFLATPRFLDALTALADNLFLMPREKRTLELRKQLRALEVDLLPNNSIYVPIGNANHRVWRIVADESIAISTKERVPCIVCLEVVDYSVAKNNNSSSNINTNNNERRKKRSLLETALMRPVVVDNEEFFDTESSPPVSPRPSSLQQFLMPGGGNLNNPTEREIIQQWKTGRPRDPQRHNSIFDKMTNYTQKGLRRLRHSQNSKNNDIVLWSSEALSGGGGSSGNNLPMAADGEISPLPNLTDEEEKMVHSNKMERQRLTPKPKPPLPPGQGNYSTALSSSSPSPSFHHHMDKTQGIELRSSPVSSRNSSRPSSPATAMGQWGSPTKGFSHENTNDQARFANESTGPQNTFEALAGIQSTNVRDANDDESWLASSLHGPSDSLYGAARSPLTLDISESRSVAQGSGIDKSNNESQRTSKSLNRPAVRPPPVVFKESWQSKEERIRSKSAFGSHPGWRLLPILIKSNDDLRQEQLASQLIYRMASILAREKVPVWLCPYEIVALTDRAGIIEAIPDTISIDSLKRNDPNYSNLKDFFFSHFGEPGGDEHADAKANFVESLAAYSIVCFIMQIKDRHNGNIMLDKRGHLIHIDFGFFFLSSPGKNSGFESAPFKLTRDFVDLMDGPDSKTFRTFRELCCRTFLSLRKNCYQITLLVEMLMVGNEDLACFRGRPEDAVKGIRDRFRLDLNDRACIEYVNDLVDESLENWRTRWYDRYQRYCVGVL